ncbi:MAG: pirin family protein [Chitinophagales bacterium]
MKTVLHRADDRGQADYGWLKARYYFSFANHYDASKVHFGLLRVLNDDRVAPGQGFGTHPHDNMEIITIPLKGVISHKDSMGSSGNIKAGDVQIMSAGSGVTHSEFNGSATEELNLFQIWIFPKERNIKPRYDQRTYTVDERKGKFQLLVSPGKEEGTLWINQDAWLSMGNFTAGETANYKLHSPKNGVYMVVVNGEVEVAGQKLGDRDALGIYDTGEIEVKVNKDTELLLIDVPMS